MSRRSNPALIGAFVVGAVGLLVAVVLGVGAGHLFKKSYPVICYFEGAVDGLGVGAPVKIKGVEIGSVAEIRLRFDQPEGSLRVPVLLQIDPDRLEGYGVHGKLNRAAIDAAVQRGLRARLQSQSLLTGLLFVQLDLVPGSEAVYVGSGEIQEVPTLPTAAAELQASLREIVSKFKKVELAALVSHATGAADALQGLASSMGRASGGARTTADEVSATAKQVQALLDSNSPVMVSLVQVLREVGAAARSVRLVADEIERDPSMLVRGKDIGGNRR